jgi:hypothetical protein
VAGGGQGRPAGGNRVKGAYVRDFGSRPSHAAAAKKEPTQNIFCLSSASASPHTFSTLSANQRRSLIPKTAILERLPFFSTRASSTHSLMAQVAMEHPPPGGRDAHAHPGRRAETEVRFPA